MSQAISHEKNNINGRSFNIISSKKYQQNSVVADISTELFCAASNTPIQSQSRKSKSSQKKNVYYFFKLKFKYTETTNQLHSFFHSLFLTTFHIKIPKLKLVIYSHNL